MFLELILAVILGICAGIFTGLIPGIHINLISVLMISVSPVLLHYTNVVSLCCFVIAMSVTHSFLDAIPSIFLGAPDSDMALGVLPGHRYLLKGLGMTALKLTVVGSFGALIFSVLIFFALIPFVRFSYPYIEDYIVFVLIAVVFFMILRDRKRLWAFFVFMLSGIFGIVVLNMPNFENPLFPLFSGLFGTSTLILSLSDNEKIPKQAEKQYLKVKNSTVLKALLSGNFSGFVTAVMPGLGASTAAVMSMQITKNLKEDGFMILMGSINTFNFILSIVTLYVLDKARNGSIIAVQKLIGPVSMNHIIVFLCSALIAGSLSVFLAVFLAKIFSRIISILSYRKIVLSVILLITILVIFLTGPLGFLILLTSTALGMIAPIIKTSRTHAMGCLLLPVIFYFLL
ncbi:MAG: tripartite tricarboxylate transporter permease [Candidatus Nanoarchaeia archaeon]|nr:tripartite tricarboxylate transporter permease [Candidatus Nanoarchaeia archaeon]